MKLIPQGLSKRLATMAGGRYVYKQEVLKISTARINTENEKIEITVEGGSILTLPLRGANEELQKFVLAPPEEKVAVELYETNGVAKTLRDAALDAIEKLKTDANFIPQALAVNAMMRTMIEMGKLELEAARLKNELRAQQ